jgi:hypothetical protein
MTSTLDARSPVSESTKKRAGSAPDRAGVIAAAKSPPRQVRAGGAERDLDAGGTRAPADLQRACEHLDGDRGHREQVRERREGERRPVLRPAEDEVERDSDRRREGEDREQPTERSHAGVNVIG